MIRSRRSGFTLLLVLWTIVTVATVATVASLGARDAVSTSANRVALTRAHWRAEGCANAALATLDEWLRTGDADDRWAALDSADGLSESSCRVTLKPAGTTMNVNVAAAVPLRRMLRFQGLDPARADSLAAAIEDWRDPDNSPRQDGAEADWYANAHRFPPTNRPFRSAAEVALVRGAEWLQSVDTLFTVEDSAVLLTRASAPVIGGLPGVNEEAIAAIIAARSEKPFPDVAIIAGRLSSPARETMMQALPVLRARTWSAPSTWFLRVTAPGSPQPIEAAIEHRLARDGHRAAIVERRSWP